MKNQIEPQIVRACMTCGTAETTRGLQCPRCNGIAHAFNAIKTTYHLDEIDGLAGTLKRDTMPALIQQAKNRHTGALLKILYRIRDMAFTAGIDADSMRLAVVRRIREQLDHEANVCKYEEEEGETGKYGRMAMDYIGKYTAQVEARDK
jgi:hypothetical protein